MAGAGAKPFVDAKIQQRKVLMFTKKRSPACNLARQILDTYKMSHDAYEVVEIECRQDCTQIENYFQTLCLTDSRSVPQLFVTGSSIGGEKEIPLLEESGELKNILATAGVLSPEPEVTA